MGSSFVVPNDAPPDSLDEHRHFLTNVLNNLTNYEAYQKQRPMKGSVLHPVTLQYTQPTGEDAQPAHNGSAPSYHQPNKEHYRANAH